MLDLSKEVELLGPELEKAIKSVLKSTQFINGPEVAALEAELASYLDVRHVISCGNGTDALMIALMAADLKPGDGVITTPFTFFATAEVIAFLGLEVQFVDVLETTFNINPEAVEQAIQPNTKAIMPVHLFGQAADMTAIMKIADKHKLMVIEDSAQATGGTYTINDTSRQNGSIGHMGCTSFFPSKNLACYGDGGAIFTDDDQLAATCRMIKNHGSRIKYTNEIIGINSRLDAMQAAILRLKLTRLDGDNDKRRQIAERYKDAFQLVDEIILPISLKEVRHVYHQFTIRLRQGLRDKLQSYLKGKGISTAIYYETPLHLQKALKGFPYAKGDLPVAERLSSEVLSLPIGPYLEKTEQEYIINEVARFFQ